MKPCWEVAASLAQYVERATRRRAPTAKARDKHSGINTIPTRAVTIPRCSLLRRAGSFQHRNCLECALSDSLCVAVGPPKLVCLLPTCLSRPGRRRPAGHDAPETAAIYRRARGDKTRPPASGAQCIDEPRLSGRNAPTSPSSRLQSPAGDETPSAAAQRAPIR